jgi:heme A synthase
MDYPNRLAGYALMAAAVLLALAMRRGLIESLGPFPVAAVALLIGMIGAMLVFTDLMVRGLYAQIGAAKRAEDEGE